MLARSVPIRQPPPPPPSPPTTRPARRRAASCPSAPSRAASTATRRATAAPNLVSILTQAGWSASTRRPRRSSRGSPKAGRASADGRTRHAEAHAGVVVLGRPPVHGRRCGVFVQAVYDENERQRARRLAAGRRQEARGRRRRSAHGRRSPFPAPFAPGSACSTTCRSSRATSSKRRSRPARSRAPGAFDTPPSELVGLGPFVLAQYVPGQRLVFERNPHYFRKAPDGDGAAVSGSADRRDRPGPERGAAAARSRARST